MPENGSGEKGSRPGVPDFFYAVVRSVEPRVEFVGGVWAGFIKLQHGSGRGTARD